MTSRTGRTLLSVIAVVAACVGVTEWTTPAEPQPASAGQRVPVTSALSACPYAESDGVSALNSRVSAAVPATAADPAAAAVAEGDVAATVVRLDDPKQQVAKLETPGATSAAQLGKLADGQNTFVASASGPTAPGFTVSATTIFDTRKRRGLASTTCPEPGTDFWFVGTGVDAGRSSELIVANVEDAPAQYDVEFYGKNGRLEVPAMRQLTLAPRAVKGPLSLGVAAEDYAADGGTSVLAVRVIVRLGRVVAGVMDHAVDDGAGRGIDWLQPVKEPLTSGVIPGIPGGPGERTLYLFAPGTEGALVTLKMAGPNGVFTPVDVPAEGRQPVQLDSVAVGAGQVVALPLDGAARSEHFSVLIEADRPVIGAIRVGTGAKVPDYGYVAMMTELGGPSVIADAREDGDFKSWVLLTAPKADAAVDLTVLIPGDAPKPFGTATVKAGSTVVVPIEKVGAAAFALVATPQPGSGAVFGSRYLTRNAGDNPFMTIEALTPSRTTSLVPEIVNDLSAGIRPADASD